MARRDSRKPQRRSRILSSSHYLQKPPGAVRPARVSLQEQVRALGGDPESGGSALGAMHRGWLELKATVTARDDKAILNECERGEDAAKARYAKALREDLPVGVRSIVERQNSGVIANHDRVRALRDAAG